jgi:hypothetical protein
MKILKMALLFFMVGIYACKDPFMPEVESRFKNLLVVEGFIHIGGETTIKLSRTSDLSELSAKPEKNAMVQIEGEDGSLLSKLSEDDGKSILPTQNLDIKKRYRLKIVTANGKTYQTDFLQSKVTPEIDSVYFKVEDKGFQVYVDTHDDSGNTKYYHWDYQETWEIRSAFSATHEYKSGEVVPRDPAINIENCWVDAKSSKILIGSSERLNVDKISLFPIIHIKGNSTKVAYTYSILLHQYALTKEAYQYLEQMKKNTEQIGGIFDAQPSELKGNIFCVSNPEEEVVGWMSAGTISQSRLFIDYEDKPESGRDWLYPELCEAFYTSPDSLAIYMAGNHSLIRYEQEDKYGVIYLISEKQCIDCRLRGTNLKPPYWPN